MQSPNTILLVDDDPENLKVLIAFLRQHNFGIIVARSGAEALQRLQQNIPDLILLDIIMPNMDGFEVCQKIQQNLQTCNIPIIFTSALSETVNKVKGFTLGGVDYITKPFQYEEVLARINTHLKLQHMQRELKELNATQNKFFSIIAHDLRNPFSGLTNISEMLLDNIENMEMAEVKDCLQAIRETSVHSCRLLENLLSWGKTQNGLIQCSMVLLSLHQVIAENILFFAQQSKHKNISLSYSVTENLEVCADKNMLDTILRNLIGNAIKYTQRNGKIDITANVRAHEVEITVNDTGIGISPENLPKLFHIESHYTTAGTASEKGSGLGLLLCKEFIHLHHGKIWAESEVGKGSRFTFTLKRDHNL